MCIDFTNLYKAYPKDSFLLPRIDQLVDTTVGHELLSFMDAYSGHNQILMYEPDEEHTSFITDRGLYCYKAMPFGLKKVGVACQRLFLFLFLSFFQLFLPLSLHFPHPTNPYLSLLPSTHSSSHYVAQSPTHLFLLLLFLSSFLSFSSIHAVEVIRLAYQSSMYQCCLDLLPSTATVQTP